MKIVVTGADGHIGAWLVKKLSENHEVTGTVRQNPTKNEARFDLITDPFPKTKFDAVIHTAALTDVQYCHFNPDQATAANNQGTRKVAEAATKNKAFMVYLSTGSVYQPTLNPSKEEHPTKPNNIYAETKLAGEQWVKQANGITLRLFHPYGPQTHPHRIINTLIRKVMEHEPIQLNKYNRPSMNPIYIKDLTALTEFLIDNQPTEYHTLNAGGAEVTNIHRLGDQISKMLNKKPVYQKTMEKTDNYIGDINRIQHLGFKHQWTLRHGLRKTIEAIK